MSPTTFYNALSINLKILPSKSHHILFHPSELQYHISPTPLENNNNTRAPFPYYTDVLLALAASNLFYKNPTHSLLWEKIDPFHIIYKRSGDRLNSLIKNNFKISSYAHQFEYNLKQVLLECCTSDKIHFNGMSELINTINDLEKEFGKPLLFNREINFSETTMRILHTLYSLLYNMRTLVAMDYNDHIKDITHESLKVDAINDYLPNASFNINDALLYFHWNSLTNYKPHPERQFTESMEQAFRTFIHNGYYLVQSLPQDFFETKDQQFIEDKLNQFQMDWLLGTPAGLLYRLREELFAIKDGYESIFWPDLSESAYENFATLESNCVIDPTQLHTNQDAA